MLPLNVTTSGTHEHGATISSQERPTDSTIKFADTLSKEEEGDKVGVHWRFRVSASIGSNEGCLSAASDVIGTIAFDKENKWFATGGIARKIRVYSFEAITAAEEENTGAEMKEHESQEEEEERERIRIKLAKRRCSFLDHDKCARGIICTPARLSSIKWVPDCSNIIGCGDYDGVLTEWDIHRGLSVKEKDEHCGQKIWSIDYSKQPPYLCASASDDGTVRLWARGSEDCVSIILSPSGSPVCCAEFNPSSPQMIALASSDSRVHIFDTRCASSPLLTLHHHYRPASYVRFLDRDKLVSAAVDSTLKLWDVSRSSSDPVRTFAAHHNVRNFVGLSVWKEGGLLACGSETNEAFAYDCRWEKPVLRHSFQVEQGASKPSSAIVSAVCWRERSPGCTLLAANSDGFLKILSGSSKITS